MAVLHVFVPGRLLDCGGDGNIKGTTAGARASCDSPRDIFSQKTIGTPDPIPAVSRGGEVKSAGNGSRRWGGDGYLLIIHISEDMDHGT
ncbi:hypothetical protein Q5Y75_03465 [Ruegeria sp. 2205SS24-7]|uniref:hypothetical protein n=1 Tax=Ruegeria discodermiae TaxID=3064389 RepID=UPI002741747E|nr:hypothetical protein [Ruegeria sp. 2205SS24-7]MDP5216265.1 hypothetical protein [Ruegeria sp. 2205SS24-7]